MLFSIQIIISSVESHAPKPSSTLNTSGRPQNKTVPVINEAPASSSSAKLILNHTSTSPTIKTTATGIVASTVTASRTASPSPSTTPPPTHATGEHTSPPKRSTDHSINSIISWPAFLNHSVSSVISDDSPESDPLAIVPDADALKTDTIEKTSPTATRLLGDLLKARPINDKVVKAPAIICPSSDNSEAVKKAAQFAPKNVESDDEEVHIIDDFSGSSSSSDDVEFVSESAVPRKPRENTTVNKHKYLLGKNSSSNTRSNSPKSAQSMTTKLTKSEDSKRQSAHSGENKEHDLDVSQIMKALKELKVICDSQCCYFFFFFNVFQNLLLFQMVV